MSDFDWASGLRRAIIACSICLGLEFVFVSTWRIYLSYSNHMRDKAAEAQGLTPEQVKELGAENGEKDIMDRKSPHFPPVPAKWSIYVNSCFIYVYVHVHDKDNVQYRIDYWKSCLDASVLSFSDHSYLVLAQ
ncbi:hypothetical protein F5890DRAFT_1588934 [Lentinula detonsa]|uniref:Uncharacterized protein n=1 Tax=Lentinula detonsa TaxID=2804962 RepID=A0AA38PR93_9AGAR|nr:hypothetical protein F5890DRAFT_1588934 [Lentinula detonsa]